MWSFTLEDNILCWKVLKGQMHAKNKWIGINTSYNTQKNTPLPIMWCVSKLHAYSILLHVYCIIIFLKWDSDQQKYSIVSK